MNFSYSNIINSIAKLLNLLDSEEVVKLHKDRGHVTSCLTHW